MVLTVCHFAMVCHVVLSTLRHSFSAVCEMFIADSQALRVVHQGILENAELRAFPEFSGHVDWAPRSSTNRTVDPCV